MVFLFLFLCAVFVSSQGGAKFNATVPEANVFAGELEL
jgi:hypothetical protein